MIDNPEWFRDALCARVDPELFFPEKGGSTAGGKLICSRCDVAKECLVYAITNDEKHGIWGGKSERERRIIKAQYQEEN